MNTSTGEAIRAFSGIHPHLAVTNDGQYECGVGAIVPWMGDLWFITYTAHAPSGSEDLLCRLDPTTLQCRAFAGSVGGTHANRMIHEESGQLIIGPYFIDGQGAVRALPLAQMPARLTATMRHLTEPQQKVYFFGMEGEFHEVDVTTLAHRQLAERHPVAGSHAKGGFTADGRVVVSNNGEWGWYNKWQEDHQFDGETGALAQWDGQQWSVIDRRQYLEIMGPGGLSGKAAPGDPLWATGWDKLSTLLSVCEDGVWRTLRLPKGSYTYDGGHGWHTEWPRIRQLEGSDRWLMTLHGTFFEFPPTLTFEHRQGLKPIITYHKMIVDFCKQGDHLVLACNDASKFDNPLLGRCQSNLWWVKEKELASLGAQPHGWGGVWLDEDLAPDTVSDPMFVGGYAHRTLHLRCAGQTPQAFELEIDSGDGQWRSAGQIDVTDGYAMRVLNHTAAGQWARLRTKGDAKAATAYWHLGRTYEPGQDDAYESMFKALPSAGTGVRFVGGIVRPRDGREMSLQYVAYLQDEQGQLEKRHYRVDGRVQMEQVDEPDLLEHFEKTLGGHVDQPDFEVDAASVIVREGGQAYRLPKGDPVYEQPWPAGYPRGNREVVTERSLWNICGTFYELPRESSGGVGRMQPICTHNRMITDYCSWRGMLVLAGHHQAAEEDEHFVRTADGLAGLWLGTVDDLWKLGKPRGQGGPWRNTPVQAGEASDPYLMTGFDHKTLELRHDADKPVRFTVEIDFLGDGSWSTLETLAVAPGERLRHDFATGFSAHWVRLRSDVACTATAWLEYR